MGGRSADAGFIERNGNEAPLDAGDGLRYSLAVVRNQLACNRVDGNFLEPYLNPRIFRLECRQGQTRFAGEFASGVAHVPTTILVTTAGGKAE